MKPNILKRLFIIIFAITLFYSSNQKIFATDNDLKESETETDKPSENGLMYAGGGTWIQGSDGRWWYRHSDGTYTTNDWEYINGKWYYFDADGWMVTGWLQLGNTWYYLLPSTGEMVTGWQYIGNFWYFFESNGAMYKGWKQLNGKWYYLIPDNGRMAVGWKQIAYGNYYNGELYWNFFNDSGEFVTDSDAHGCASGFNTFLDHKHLKGTSLNYYIDSGTNCVTEINMAASYWNTISNHSAELRVIGAGIQF